VCTKKNRKRDRFFFVFVGIVAENLLA